jgi:hypothetical protein
MRTVLARIFDYSLDGIIAEEGTSFFDFCRDLPDDPSQVDRTRDFYENAAMHIMGRKHYQDSAQYFPQAALASGGRSSAATSSTNTACRSSPT